MNRILQIDWRILLGACFTLIWLAAGVVYLLNQQVGLEQIPLENLGSFLEGGFAPLAFMWLVIGLFIQQKELADNTEVLRQSTILAEKQTEALAASELNQRQEAFFKIAENVKQQLGVITGMIYISRFGATEGDIVAPSRIGELWHMLSTGDDSVFHREFLSLNYEEYGGATDVFYGSEVRAKHSRNFISTFDRLLGLAEKCDADGVITGTVTQTAHGLIYNILKNAEPDADLAPQLVDAKTYQDRIQQPGA